MKTLYPNFENVTFELWKRYIGTLKTLYPIFENVISELWNVISELKYLGWKVERMNNKPGTAQVGAISKAQK